MAVLLEEEDYGTDIVDLQPGALPGINDKAMCVGGYEVPTVQWGADEEFMVFNTSRCKPFLRNGWLHQGTT